ncbi:NADPH2:quinone reductase OS=Castellaniella defragrans OX=75697 GN=HNR28_003231 PE=4 SV=1 [Castellaniella defragrans]
MQAIEITQPGGPEVLQPAQRTKPEPGPGEVLIEVHAAGVNRPDVLQRLGHYPPPAGASDLPGLEVAGTIVGGDPSSAGLKLGDAVCALLAGGGYAQYCAVPAVQCLPLPKGLSMVEGAALPETYFTVWTNVFDRGHLDTSETLLVHGGASGIGTTAIALARAFGHTVYATAGSDERVHAIEAMGCTHGINYHTQDFVAEIKKLTNDRGVDVILDMVAGSYLERNIQALADDGRIVIIAQLGGNRGTLQCGDLMRRRLTVTGSTLRSRPPAFKGRVALALHQHVWPLLEAGKIRPAIHATFPLAEASRAHAMMDAGEQIGKIVLTVK